MKHTLFLLLFVFTGSLQAQDSLANCGTNDRLLKSFISSYDFWKSQVIPYKFDEKLNQSTKDIFFKAIDNYHNNTNICFIPHRGEDKKLMVYPSTDGNGYGSANEITIVPILMIVVHEIGHALGLVHEQQRPDRDNYITILTENIQPTYLNQFTILNASIDKYDTPYDYKSVMHYNAYAFSKNSQKTILAPDGITLGGSTLSPIDIAFINKKYPKKMNCDSIRVNRIPFADFEYDYDATDCGSATINFKNNAIGFDSFYWTFEGGTPSYSTDFSPTVEFLRSGKHKVTLVTNNDFGTARHEAILPIRKCNYDEMIQPNPTTGMIYINTGTNYPRTIRLRVLTLSGKMVYEEERSEPLGFKYLISLNLPNDLQNGVYIVHLDSEEYTKAYKVILNR